VFRILSVAFFHDVVDRRIMASIRTPGSLFAKLIEANNLAKKQEGAARGDGFCYFVGGRGSGKSTLLNRFLYPNRVSTLVAATACIWILSLALSLIPMAVGIHCLRTTLRTCLHLTAHFPG